MTRRIHVALFADEAQFLAAARTCRERGLALLDAFTPYPVHGIDVLLDVRPSRLPWVCLAGGATGLAAALLFQYWSSITDWPLNVGGKPFDSLPAFLPVAFETTVLFAGLVTAAALWLRSSLLPGRKPRRELPGTLDDRFALLVAHKDAANDFAETRALLESLGAVACWDEMEDAS
ncbi:MAG TPA: DUF3341 domain-containing protein [Planctomycetota bacterium]